MNRNITTVAPLHERIGYWNAAKTATEKHTKLAGSLMRNAVDILKVLQEQPTEEATNALQRAANALERGVKMEREAYREVLELLENMPK